MADDPELQVPKFPLQSPARGVPVTSALAVQARQLHGSGRLVRNAPTRPRLRSSVLKPPAKGRGLAQAFQCLPGFTEQSQRRAQLEADLRRPAPAWTGFLEAASGPPAPVQPGRASRFADRAAAYVRPARVAHRLLPQLAPKSVVGEPLDLLREAIGVKRLDSLDDPRVQRAAPLLEQAAVGHLMGERVLERVLEIREEARLVEKLGRLETRETAPQRSSADVRDRLQQRERHVLADDGGGLEQPLVLGREAVDASREDRLRRSPGSASVVERSRPADRRRARRRAPASRPGSARSPRGRTDCPPSARSGAA